MTNITFLITLNQRIYFIYETFKKTKEIDENLKKRWNHRIESLLFHLSFRVLNVLPIEEKKKEKKEKRKKERRDRHRKDKTKS